MKWCISYNILLTVLKVQKLKRYFLGNHNELWPYSCNEGGEHLSNIHFQLSLIEITIFHLNRKPMYKNTQPLTYLIPFFISKYTYRNNRIQDAAIELTPQFYYTNLFLRLSHLSDVKRRNDFKKCLKHDFFHFKLVFCNEHWKWTKFHLNLDN